MLSVVNERGPKVFSSKIDAYEILYSENPIGPTILLKAGGRLIGRIRFRPNDTALAADDERDGVVNMNFHLFSYPNIVDLLRNEKPLYLHAMFVLGGACTIATAEEPVGEEET